MKRGSCASPACRDSDHRNCSGSITAIPAPDWTKIEKPESVGFSVAKLAALSAWLKAGRPTAMMVSVGGKSLFEYGDLKLVSKVASVRKSILAMLYGKFCKC